MLQPFIDVLNSFFGSVTTEGFLAIGITILFGIFLILLFKR